MLGCCFFFILLLVLRCEFSVPTLTLPLLYNNTFTGGPIVFNQTKKRTNTNFVEKAYSEANE